MEGKGNGKELGKRSKCVQKGEKGTGKDPRTREGGGGRGTSGSCCLFSIYIRRQMGRGGNEEGREVVNLSLNYHDAVKLYSYRHKTRCINCCIRFVSRMH